MLSPQKFQRILSQRCEEDLALHAMIHKVGRQTQQRQRFAQDLAAIPEAFAPSGVLCRGLAVVEGKLSQISVESVAEVEFARTLSKANTLEHGLTLVVEPVVKRGPAQGGSRCQEREPTVQPLPRNKGPFAPIFAVECPLNLEARCEQGDELPAQKLRVWWHGAEYK